MAYMNIYDRLQRQLTPDGQVQVDALLGLPGADEELTRARVDAVSASGFEVG